MHRVAPRFVLAFIVDTIEPHNLSKEMVEHGVAVGVDGDLKQGQEDVVEHVLETLDLTRFLCVRVHHTGTNKHHLQQLQSQAGSAHNNEVLLHRKNKAHTL